MRSDHLLKVIWHRQCKEIADKRKILFTLASAILMSGFLLQFPSSTAVWKDSSVFALPKTDLKNYGPINSYSQTVQERSLTEKEMCGSYGEYEASGWLEQWSHTYGGYGHSQFAQPCGDIDGDGGNEIIVGGYEASPSWGKARILSYNATLGTYKEEYNWYVSGGTYHSPSGSCVLDLDESGDLEFVVSWTYSGADGIYAYDWDGKTLTLLDRYLCATVFDVYACDYDGDGHYEVLASGRGDEGTPWQVMAFGWVEGRFAMETMWRLGTYSWECPRIGSGDIKGDGKTYVVACVSKSFYDTAGTWALSWNPTLSEWEEERVYAGLIGGGTHYGVVVGDVNDNGIAEIGIGNNVPEYVGAAAVLLEWDGTAYKKVWGGSWPDEYAIIEASAIGDADNDRKNEFCVGGGNVHVIGWTGNGYIEESRITQTAGLLSSVIIADCDNDGFNEVKACDILDLGPDKEWIFKHPPTPPDNILIEKVIKPTTLVHNLIAFRCPDLLSTSDEISPVVPAPMEVPFDHTWFYWIDDFPSAMFAKPTRYVFIDWETGEYVVEEQRWWPMLNGVELWATPETFWNESEWVYSTCEIRTRVYVDPQTITVLAGSTFNVGIMIEDTFDLCSLEIHMSFDSAVAQCTRVTGGLFLGGELSDVEIDNVNGTIQFFHLEPPGSGLNGSGTLATVAFHCLGPGATELGLYSVILADSRADKILCTKENGHVTQLSENHSPYLSDANVDPPNGHTGTLFTFEVKYYDQDNDDAEIGEIWIYDETWYSFDMDHYSGSPISGEWFIIQLYGFTMGTHPFYFRFSDGEIEVREPRTDYFWFMVEHDLANLRKSNIITSASSQSNKRALIIEGNGSGIEHMDATAENWVTLLKQEFGYSDGEIFYLGPGRNGDDYFYNVSTYENINKTVQNLSATLKSGDYLSVFIVAHGDNKNTSDPGVDGYVYLMYQEELWDSELAQLLGQMADGVSITVVIQSCYSGVFMDNLCTIPQVKSVLTSTDCKSTSWFCDVGEFGWTKKIEGFIDPNQLEEGKYGCEFSSGLMEDLEKLASTYNFNLSSGQLWLEGFKGAQEKDAGYVNRQALLKKAQETYSLWGMDPKYASYYAPDPQFSTRLFEGDLDMNGIVNILDISIVAAAYNSTPGDPNWNPIADTKSDGIVNVLDIAIVAKNYGNEYY